MREQQVQSQTNKNLTKDTFPRHDQRNQSGKSAGNADSDADVILSVYQLQVQEMT